jgi:Tol biopolymer transport system component
MPLAGCGTLAVPEIIETPPALAATTAPTLASSGTATPTQTPSTPSTLTPIIFDPDDLLEGSLYFQSGTALFVLDEDGSTIGLLEEGIDYYSFHISQQRNQAIYTKQDQRAALYEIFLLDLETLESTLLITNECLIGFLVEYTIPSWSFDQNGVIYGSCDSGPLDLFLLNLNSNSSINLTHSAFSNFSPAISPVDDMIAYAYNQPGSLGLYTIRGDGSGVRRLANFSTGEYLFNIAWSPDGTRISFMYSPEFYPYEIYVVNADGTGLVQLTQTDWYQTGEHFNLQFVWSPSGAEILFSGYVENIVQLFSVNVETEEVTQLTFGNNSIHAFSWSPDEEGIIFVQGDTLMYMGIGNDIGPIEMISADELEGVTEIFWLP